LVRLQEQRLDDLAELESTRTRTAEHEREAREWTRFPEAGPYSVPFADRLREDLQTEQLKVANGTAWLASRDQLIGSHREALAQAEERVRQIDEQLESASEPALVARLDWQRDLERLRRQVAATSMAVLDLEGRILEESLQGSRSRAALLQRQLVIAEAGATLTPSDLQLVAARIERERDQFESELAVVQKRRETAAAALKAVREELGQVQDRPDTTSGVKALAIEKVAVREAQLDAAETGGRVLRLLLEGGNLERALWEQRLAAHNTNTVSTLRESARRLRLFSRRIDLWMDRGRQELAVSSSLLQVVEGQLNSLPPDSGFVPLVRERLAALRERDQSLLRLVRAVETLQRLCQRWEEGLRAAHGRLPFTGRVQSLFSDTRTFLQNLWDFELITAEDTITVDGVKVTGKRSVTVGKIVKALVILLAGIWIIGLLTRLGEPIIARKLKIEPNQASLIRRWLRALLIGCWVLFSLVSVKIPLTVFAFAGGALAIGLGFGMQTILKNLVSGMILLFERPFRVGDVLDVGGQKGTITSIGLRASVLNLWDGTETLIPNSSLLENNVTNWTYSNPKVRFTIAVGVAYGSDVRRVIQLLNEVTERHGLVEREPKPLVLFTDFGDSTLAFELRFWVDVQKANAGQVSSDLRLMIASAFAENGIAIDYPQRDVHLHATAPIPVQMVSGPEVRAALPDAPPLPAKPPELP
jgi:potassium efflux system protein